MKEIRLWLVTSLDRKSLQKKEDDDFVVDRFFFETVVVVVVLLLLLLLSSRKNPSLSLCGEFVRSRCVPETRKKMDALQRFVPRGGFSNFYLGFRVLIKLGFRKRAKGRREDETSRRRSDEGDEEEEDDEDDEEEQERKEEKDDFPGDDKRVRSFCVNYCGVSRREEMR